MTMTWLDGTVADGAEFACLLSHDVDRPYKTYQSLYYAVAERDPGHLADLRPSREPYWTMDDLMALERDLGVRSSWYFVDEQSLLWDRPWRDLLSPSAWRLYAGRYSIEDDRIRDLIERLDRGGWEVGLHGSYESYRDGDLLAAEKERLEALLGHEVTGVRQHYLNVDRPRTWRLQRAAGLQYDATPGSGETVGFADGHAPIHPFDDEFAVFPVTVMDTALPDPDTEWARAWGRCRALLEEAREHTAAMSLLFHPRYFSDDFPGYERLYRRIVRQALEMGAWVGPIGDLYASMTRGKRGLDTGGAVRRG